MKEDAGKKALPDTPTLPSSASSTEVAVRTQRASRATELGDQWLADVNNADLNEAFSGGDIEACDWTQQNLHLMTDEVVHLAELEGTDNFLMQSWWSLCRWRMCWIHRSLSRRKMPLMQLFLSLLKKCHPKDSIGEAEGESDAPEDADPTSQPSVNRFQAAAEALRNKLVCF